MPAHDSSSSSSSFSNHGTMLLPGAAQAAWGSVARYHRTVHCCMLPHSLAWCDAAACMLLLSGTSVVGLPARLTAEGFRYLLKSTHEQVWILLREYIRTAEQHSGEPGGWALQPSASVAHCAAPLRQPQPRCSPWLRVCCMWLVVPSCQACCCAACCCGCAGKELASTLSFLMQLSFRRVWQPYPLQELSQQEQDIAQHMAQLGLVHTFNQVGRCTLRQPGGPLTDHRGPLGPGWAARSG